MKNKKQNAENEEIPLRYWFVEIALTSGEFLNFYVKAIDEFEAYKKADGYSQLVSNEQLKNKLKSFKLMA